MAITLDGTTGITTPSQTTNGDVIIADKIVHLDDTNTAIRFPAVDTFTVETAGSERLRIDSAGNVGIGANNPGYRLDVASADTTADLGYALRIRANATAGAGAIQFTDNPVAAEKGFIAVDNSSNMKFGTSGNERMRIDSSGNFYVGTTNQSGGSNITFNQSANADMKIAASVSTATRAAYQVFVNTTVTTVGTENSTGGSLASGTAAYSTVLANSGAYPISFATNNTERMRITSEGRFYVNQTTGNGNTLQRLGVTYDGSTEWGIALKTTAASGDPISFQNSSGTQVGRINTTNVATGYITTSDYRLKENVQPMQDALSKIYQLNPVTYTWKSDGSDGQGFIAHELQAVVPDCVSGKKDAVDAEGNPQYQGIDTSFLVATLVKAVQEQQALITALTTRIEALETTR